MAGLLHPFTGTEAKAKQPINEDLTDLKYKENIENLQVEVDALSVGGGAAVDTGAIGEILLGAETDEAIYWKRRFHPLQHMLNSDSENPSGFDPEGKSLKNELLSFIQSNDSGVALLIDANSYLGQGVQVAKGSSISFKIKKGINFFGFGHIIAGSHSNNVEILIDGLTPSALSLKDKNGIAASDTFSFISTTTFYQVTDFMYGLDGEEHVVTITNNDSGSNFAYIDFIEVGYRAENPTIDETVKINTGKVNIRGTELTIDETEVSFSKLDKNGHTGSIVVNTAGTVSALDGESPAMTQVKAEEAVAFSSTVTTLPVKNNLYFPVNGICLLSTPYGNHHLFSYGAKTDTTIQAHSFDSVLWQSKPTEDFTPLNNFAGGAGTATGDLNINYYGTAPILIDSTNNKIDFEITIAGIKTTHVATIASGRYSADLIPLEKAIRSAMQTAKAISGEYHLKYNSESQLWNIYVDDIEVEAFDLLFSTGLNVANSIHITLGFASSDLTGALSYLAETEKQHLCCRALERDAVFMHSEDPRIKYSKTNTVAGVRTNQSDIEDRLNIGQVRFLSGTGNMMQIFVDEDCCGLDLSFLSYHAAGMITFQIDDGQCLYLLQTDTAILNTSVRGRLLSSFISFPRGSRKITVRCETSTQFYIDLELGELYFAGCRQYFSKPAYEKLSKSQAIIKTFDISPISLYATIYGHNSGVLYSSTGTDNINTITETGSWGADTTTSIFNRGARLTSVSGDYVDINFTLVGNGGGISIKVLINVPNCQKIACFISQSAIVEGTDRVSNTHCTWSTVHYDQDAIGVMGLKAGTYTARFKLEHAALLYTTGIVIYDTIQPEENKNTVTDVSGTGQSVTYPINVRREVIQQDANERVPNWLQRSGYKEGKTSLVNYLMNSPAWINTDDSTEIINRADRYYGIYFDENIVGAEISISTFCKSVSQSDTCYSDGCITVQPFVDGVQTLNNYSQRVQVKGGSVPTATRTSQVGLSSKIFTLSCTLSAGLIYNIADTRGLKNNQTIILFDGTNYEKAVIDSFVIGVSFTIKKALVVATGVIESVDFQGFHTYKLVTGATSVFRESCFIYEPLTITPSKAIQRRSINFKYEKVSVTHRGIASGGDAYYPVHSDGVVGNWTTSTIEVVGMNGAAYGFDQDLKNITTTGGLNVKISSERLVPVLDERDRF